MMGQMWRPPPSWFDNVSVGIPSPLTSYPLICPLSMDIPPQWASAPLGILLMDILSPWIFYLLRSLPTDILPIDIPPHGHLTHRYLSPWTSYPLIPLSIYIPPCGHTSLGTTSPIDIPPMGIPPHGHPFPMDILPTDTPLHGSPTHLILLPRANLPHEHPFPMDIPPYGHPSPQMFLL